MSEPELIRQIKAQASDRHLRECLVAGAAMEGGIEPPYPPGDAGWSRGPYQIKTWRPELPGWKGHPISAEEAEDPAAAVAYAIKNEWDHVHQVNAGLDYRRLASWYDNPIEVAYRAERPAHYYSETQQAAARAAIARWLPEERSMVEKPAIVWKPANAANYDVGHGGYAWEFVVWHRAEGSAAATISWFQNPASRASTHYLAAFDGTVYQFVSLDNAPYAHGKVEVAYDQAPRVLQENWGINPNKLGIGIECEGKAGEPLTPAQRGSLVRLTAWLFQDVILPGGAVGVDVDRDHVLMHRQISPLTRTCPGWDEAFHLGMIAEVRATLGLDAPPAVIVPAYRVELVAELRGLHAAAVDDEVRAAVRKAEAARKLAALGETV